MLQNKNINLYFIVLLSCLFTEYSQSCEMTFHDTKPENTIQKLEEIPQEVLNQKVEALQLTDGINKALKAKGIYSIGDLLQRSEQDLLQIPNIGKKSIVEIKERLAVFTFILTAFNETTR